MKKLGAALKVYFKLMKDLRFFHEHCDVDSFANDNEWRLWRKYDMLFNPENYTAEELEET
jgi:hypothetical protein